MTADRLAVRRERAREAALDWIAARRDLARRRAELEARLAELEVFDPAAVEAIERDLADRLATAVLDPWPMHAGRQRHERNGEVE
jgi:hypothetical protein